MAERRTAERSLVRGYVDAYPAEAARVVERIGAGEIARFLERQGDRRAAEVFARLTPAIAGDVLARLSADGATAVLRRLDPVRAAAAAAALSAEDRERVLGALEPALAAELTELMSYPAGSAGALMDTRLALTFRPDATARDVVTRLRAIRRRGLYEVFVVDADNRLLGSFPVQDTVAVAPGTTLGELVGEAPVAVPVTAGRDEVVALLTEKRLRAVPVVDFEGRLVGAIRYATLVAAAAKEASADVQTMVGVSKEEGALSSPWFAIRKRLPWLQINLLTAFAAASVVSIFEETIAAYTALAVLLPVVAGQSGNTGAQSLAVVMRGLALREVRVRQWLPVLVKEGTVGAVNGVAVAVSTCAGVYVWSGSLGLCAIIGMSMVLSMFIAGVAGAAVPLVLSSLRQDPAQSSSIILTTVTDIAGFFSFLGLATALSGLLGPPG